jgi:hypothetical protein
MKISFYKICVLSVVVFALVVSSAPFLHEAHAATPAQGSTKKVSSKVISKTESASKKTTKKIASTQKTLAPALITLETAPHSGKPIARSSKKKKTTKQKSSAKKKV